MIIELKPELTEETVKSFISERENDVKEAKKKAIAMLKTKAGRLRKQEAESDEANVLSKAAIFLEGTPVDKLMLRALLDKKSLQHSYNNSESTAEQRAIFQFASTDNVKPTIHLFREQYPNWKKAKKQLMPKMEQNNNNKVQSELTSGQELEEENTAKLKKKSKRIKKRKEEGKDAIDNGTENGSVPQEKKMKRSATEITNDSETAGETPGVPKKKRKNPIEEVLMNATANPDTIVATEDKSEESEQEGASPKWQINPKGKQQGGKFYRQSNANRGQFNRFGNDSKTCGENTGSPNKKNLNAIEKVMINAAINPDTSFESHETTEDKTEEKEVSEQENANPKWQTNPRGRGQRGNFSGRGQRGNFNDRRGQRNGYGSRNSSFEKYKPMPKWKIKQIAPRGSANLIDVTDEWRNKCISPKKDDEQKPSLLRPTWLTNPEDYKPEPMFEGLGNVGHSNQRSRPFNKFRGRGRGNRRGNRR